MCSIWPKDQNDTSHEAKCWKIKKKVAKIFILGPKQQKCGKDGDMPHGNGHTSHNMHARDMVYISKYWHCQCESIDMQTMSLACILSET